MNKIIIILISLINYSCSSQNKKEIDITGNWYNDTEKVEVSYYVEIFIDDESFNIYNEYSGFGGHIDYTMENNILYYIVNDTEKEEKGIVKIIDKSTISIGDGNIILKRINEGLKLEGLLRKNKNEKDYLKFFNERKAIWEKSHKKW